MKKVLFIIFIVLMECNLFSQKNDISKNTITNYWTDIIHWKQGRSSVLIEEKKNEKEYEWEMLDDDDLSTAWAEGVNGDGIGEWVIVFIDGDYQYLNYEDHIENLPMNLTLKINNGFCRTETLFKNNNRVKRANLAIYEVPLQVGQHKTEAIEEPIKSAEIDILINDSMKTQYLEMKFNLVGTYTTGNVCLFLKLTILEVYPGEKYNDTCISELHATADVIKEKKPEVTKWKKSFFRKDKE